MAKTLNCVPDDVTLRCGGSTTVRVKTSDDAQGVKLKALGYDKTVAAVDPVEGTTTKDGFLEVTITCAQQGLCPGSTTVTFDAKGYDDDSLEIECESVAADDSFARVAFVEVPVRRLPKLLSQYFSVSVRSSREAVVIDEIGAA